MHTYETIFITPPNLTEDVEKSTVEMLTQIIESAGGTIAFADRMGRRRLAYPIRKFEDGVYIRFLYDAGIDVPKELARRMKLSENVLRGLTVRLEKEWAQQSKEDAVREIQRRHEAAAAAVEAEKKAAEEAEKKAAEEAEKKAAEEAEKKAAAEAEKKAAEEAEKKAAEEAEAATEATETDEAAPADETAPAEEAAPAAEGDAPAEASVESDSETESKE